MSEIEDLVGRLRAITGYAAATPLTPAKKVVASPAETRISEDSLLILQQSLRRHPCLGLFGRSRSDVHSQLLQQLEDATAATAATDSSNVSESASWRIFINRVAERLEVERLSGVFCEPESRLNAARGALCRKLGIDDVPDLAQVGDGFACPWNVLAVLEDGLFFDQGDFVEFSPAHLDVPNPTASIRSHLQRIHENTYDTMAWLHLLHQMMSFPISSVRSVWHAALYHFPTAAPLVCVYVRLEMAELSRKQRLEVCRGEADVKGVYEDYLRLLNVFYRHVPHAFSCELYTIFFYYLAEYIHPDSTSLDQLYRTCLRRDVGMLPQSTALWMQFLNWRSSLFRDQVQRREWKKRLYQRILAIPLLGLDAVKEEYELFVATEYRGRVAPDEKIEVEKRLARVKAEGEDLSRLMYFFYPTEWEPPSSTHMSFPYTLYLARPLAIDGSLHSLHIRESVLARIEMDLWAMWHTLLQRIRRPLFSDTGSEVLHYARCRAFLAMLACYFPHQPTPWMELLEFCVHRQPLLSDKERFQSVGAAIDLAVSYRRHDICVRLFVAHVYHVDLNATDIAFGELKTCLLQLRAWLLQYIRNEEVEVATAEEVLERLQHITIVAVNYMRMGNVQGSGEHVQLVARFVMHQIDFLSLTMAVLRRLLKSSTTATPAPYLRPFHFFCSHWVALELIRNRAAGNATLILQQWCEHLKMILRSAKSKAWSCEECGVDELVLDACANLLTADPSRGEVVDKTLVELEDAASQCGTGAANFLYLVRQFRHRFFLPIQPVDGDYTSDILLQAKLLLPRTAPHRYDTDQFRCPLPRRRLHPSGKVGAGSCEADALETETASLALGIEDPQSKSSRTSYTFPAETLWTSNATVRNSSALGRPPADRMRHPSRPHGNADAIIPELPNESTSLPSRLAVVSEAVVLPSLVAYLSSGRLAVPGEDPGDGKAATKLPPLDQLEEFIVALPSLYEYNPREVEEDGRDVSTEWVLRALLNGEALC